jgi:ABC-type phosphate/phosphonate transport system substrate-binding protein
MYRRTLLTTTASLTAAAFAGCSSSNNTSNESSDTSSERSFQSLTPDDVTNAVEQYRPVNCQTPEKTVAQFYNGLAQPDEFQLNEALAFDLYTDIKYRFESTIEEYESRIPSSISLVTGGDRESDATTVVEAKVVDAEGVNYTAQFTVEPHMIDKWVITNISRDKEMSE